MRILVDIDSTIADLLPVWLSLYNTDYEHNLTPADIIEWDIQKFVKPECGAKIYEYLDKYWLYDNVKPIDRAVSGIKFLRDRGHQIVYVSAGVSGVPMKAKWLERHGFDPGKDFESYVVAYNKSFIKGDLLIDDRPENIESFGVPNSILFDQPWNRSFEWVWRATSWHDITRWLI